VTPPQDQWAVPPPPGPGRIRGSRVAAGIGVAIAGHLLTLTALLVDVNLLLVGQVLLFVAALVVSIVLIVKVDQGWGVGIIIGWSIGIIVLPDVGIAVCIGILNQMSGGSR
jgi:hypothetical protein